MVANELENLKGQIRKINADDLDNENSIRLIKEIKKELIKLSNNLKKIEHKAEEKISKEIIANYKDQFTRDDLFKRFADYPKEGIVKALRKLIKEKKVDRIGWSLYSTHATGSEPIIRLPEEMEILRKLLNDNGINFLITGSDILQEYVNLIPRKVLHLIYVVKGSGEYAKDIIQKRMNQVCYLNPSRKEVRNLFATIESDIIVIREVGESSIEYHKEGVALIEKAIVDLYFETTRKRIPFEASELAYILKNTLPRVKIDYKRLLRAAARRNIQSEFIRVFKALDINMSYEKIEESINDKADKVIRLLR
jgi:hypothetical protein